jgi:hypothetical protein
MVLLHDPCQGRDGHASALLWAPPWRAGLSGDAARTSGSGGGRSRPRPSRTGWCRGGRWAKRPSPAGLSRRIWFPVSVGAHVDIGFCRGAGPVGGVPPEPQLPGGEQAGLGAPGGRTGGEVDEVADLGRPRNYDVGRGVGSAPAPIGLVAHGPRPHGPGSSRWPRARARCCGPGVLRPVGRSPGGIGSYVTTPPPGRRRGGDQRRSPQATDPWRHPATAAWSVSELAVALPGYGSPTRAAPVAARSRTWVRTRAVLAVGGARRCARSGSRSARHPSPGPRRPCRSLLSTDHTSPRTLTIASLTRSKNGADGAPRPIRVESEARPRTVRLGTQ